MRKGFSLVEMLVVIGIISVLTGVSVSAYSALTRKAARTHGAELVSNVAVALNAYFLDKGRWPSALATPAAGGDGELDEKAAVPLAANKLLSLSYDTGSKKLTGADRFGIVTPWALRVIKRMNKSDNSTETRIPPSNRPLKKHILHYALDLDGDGITEARVGGETVKIRSNAAVWSIGAEGGDSNGDPWPYKEGKRRMSDIYSWTDKQVEY